MFLYCKLHKQYEPHYKQYYIYIYIYIYLSLSRFSILYTLAPEYRYQCTTDRICYADNGVRQVYMCKGESW